MTQKVKHGINVFAAILTGLSPWLTKLSAFKIISDGYQPELNVSSGLFAAVAYMSLYAFANKSAKYKKKWLLAASVVLMAACFLACLAMTQILGVVWAPDSRVANVFIFLIWITLYLCIFVAFAGVICSAGMLIPPEPPSASKPK
jgi:hypothetical protein